MTSPESVSLIVLTQEVACKSRHRKAFKVFEALPKCHVCESESGRTAQCVFSGCRTVVESNRIAFRYDPVIKKVAYRFPIYRTVFNMAMTRNAAQLKMVACARVLLPLLVAEQSHIRQSGLVRRPRELEFRVTCDVCHTALFSQCWFCANCGRELCGDCVSSLTEPSFVGALCSSHHNTLHAQADLLPLTRFIDEELEETIQQMKLGLAKITSPVVLCHPPNRIPAPQSGSTSVRHTPRFDKNRVTFTEFQSHLARGIPVVITNTALQGKWDPAYFIRTFATVYVTVQDCETGQTFRSSILDFFREFGGDRARDRIWKIKDWPTQSLFSQQCPELFQDFENSIPFGCMTRLDGILNAAVHFPLNGIAPDLGPKLYIATATVQDNHHNGSTKLHMDLTDALNVMCWASNFPDGKPGYALWHLFSEQDIPTLRQFFRNRGYMGAGCPIHSQSIYMSPEILDALFIEHGVRPYVIHQYAGDTVFIPACTPHQVCNLVDGIKAACDFISVENLRKTQKLVPEFRTERLLLGGDDVLNLYNTLLYAFWWLSVELKSLPIGERVEDPAVGGEMNIELFDSAMPIDDDGLHAIPPNTCDHPPGPRSSARSIRRKEKRKIQIAAAAFGKRPSGCMPGHAFSCPFSFCLGEFNRGGLFDHLHSSHSESISLVKYSEEEMTLRRPKQVPDSEVSERLKQYILSK